MGRSEYISDRAKRARERIRAIVLTVFKSAPAGDRRHAAGEVDTVLRHANRHDVLVELHRRLQLEKRQVILERRRIVAAVHDDAAHVSRYAAFGLQLSRDVELAEHRDQGSQEAAEAKQNEAILDTCALPRLTSIERPRFRLPLDNDFRFTSVMTKSQLRNAGRAISFFIG